MSAQPKKVGPMDQAHVMDYAILHLDHPRASKRTVTLVDMEVNVFGLDEIQGSTRPIAAIILGHGWMGKASLLDQMASGLLGEIRRLDAQAKRSTRDVIVVTMDQRNHGNRQRNNDGLGFETSLNRLATMAITVYGGMQDQQLLMDFLPGYLFPHDEREVVEWMTAGISMGGHVVWRLLREDPRIRIGVPIITVPGEALGNLLTTRSRRNDTLGKSSGKAAAHYPTATREYYEAAPRPDVYDGKKILALCGQLDRMLPPKFGDAAFKDIQARVGGDCQMWVQEGRGHVVSPEMVQRAAEWFYRWGVCA